MSKFYPAPLYFGDFLFLSIILDHAASLVVYPRNLAAVSDDG